MCKNDKIIIILIGAESTATRAITEQFSRHPKIFGTPNAESHSDVLDDVWLCLEKRQISEAKNILSTLIDSRIIFTRRSVPHGIKPGIPAEYGSFPKLDEFIELALELDCKPFVLVTTRSPIPNIMSWKSERASSQGSEKLAYKQYLNCYNKIFFTLQKHKTPYFILSAEQFVLDENDYMRSLFDFFEIGSVEIMRTAKKDINTKRYLQYFETTPKFNIKDV
jgi:hypothetical protein